MMDRRENMLALINHQPHDHVPNMGTDICSSGGNLLTFDCGPLGGGFDGFGMEWASSTSAMGAGLPAPGKFLLEDVTEWKKVVKFPDITTFDWEGLAAQQLANFNPKTQILEFGMWNAQFLRLTHLMGFENGLIAMAVEPEACLELLDAITDYKIQVAEYAVKYFKPDTICPYDDVATVRGPFMSPDTYRTLIKPGHKKFNDAVKAMGVIPNLHVCGKCDELVGDYIDEGAHMWEICEPTNDLVSLAEEHGDKIAFLGGYAMNGPLSYTPYTEEELRASVREAIDKYAPAGNYAFMGMLMFSDMQKFISAMVTMSDEAVKYGEGYYRR